MSITVPTVTGYSTFWQMQSQPTYAMLSARSYEESAIARVLSRGGFRGVRAVMRRMNGTAVGSTATDTYARVSAPQGLTDAQALGGSRTIDTVTSVSRATVAADLTYENAQFYDKLFNMAPAISSYPVDGSGNGGGGKAGR